MLRLKCCRVIAPKPCLAVSSSSSTFLSSFLFTSSRFSGGAARASFSAKTVTTSNTLTKDDAPRTQTESIRKDDNSATSAPNTSTVNTSTTSTKTEAAKIDDPSFPKPEAPLWPNCDTIEEIIEEEKFGAEGEEDKQPPVQPEHVVLAFRAFVWGTFWAFVGVGTIAAVAMKLGGFTSVKEVLAYVGDKDRRRLAELKAQGIEVIEYEVDLTNPSAVPDQLTEVWNHILTASGAAAEIESAIAAATKENEEEESGSDKKKVVEKE